MASRPLPLRLRSGAAAARVRRVSTSVVRRLHLLPAGVPDGIGQDDELRGARIDAEILVHFPDTADALYQLEQWYAAFRAVHRVHPLAVLVRDSRVAARVRAAAGLPVVAIGRDATLDDLLGRSDVRMALYVNHSVGNFHLLRHPSVVHVSLLHGDSDKTVVVSNQTKAYDYAFVAGRAAVDRARAHLALFDTARLIPIGRAALDAEQIENAAAGDPGAVGPSPPSPEGRRAVLYAPTWEGSQPTAFYGSVDSHGEAIVTSLLGAGFRVIYRPHPLTGVRLPGYGAADGRIRGLIRDADALEPTGGHRVDVARSLQSSFDDADLLVCDVSAVAIDWLPSGKPLVMTVPERAQAVAASTALESVVPRLDTAHAADIAAVATREISDDPSGGRRLALVDYYLGDIAPGTALTCFLASIEDLLARRDAERDRHDGGRPDR